MRRFPWLVVLLVVVVGLGGRSPGAFAKGGGGGAIAFSRPTISGIQGNGFEQDVRVDAQGRIYTSVPDSLSSLFAMLPVVEESRPEAQCSASSRGEPYITVDVAPLMRDLVPTIY